MFRKKKKEPEKRYAYRPREYDRDEKIALQKIVSNIPVTRNLLSQELLVTATNNFIIKNIKIGQTAAQNVNTTQYPQLFFKSLSDLISSTEELVKVEPYWRFEGSGPTDQLKEINSKKDAIIKGFICDSFKNLLTQLEGKKSNSAKQKLFDEYQAALMNGIGGFGDEYFEYFKELCKSKLGAAEENVDAANREKTDCAIAADEAETSGETENL